MDVAISGIIESGYRNMVHREGDYVGEDGLMYCGVCGNKKEAFKTFFGNKTVKVPCLCYCDELERFRAEEAQREAERKNRILRLWSSSMMDVKYKNASFDTFTVTPENEKNFGYCKRYVEAFSMFADKNQGLLFYGDVGTGKSYAAACIANELINRGITVVMTSFARILGEIRRGAEEERSLMQLINSAKLVVFDDFGAERNTEYAMEKIFDILDQRYRSKLPMIITTNLGFVEMRDETDIRYKRLYDRIFEVCFPMEFKMVRSWRREQANDRYTEMRKLLSGDQN